MNIEEILRKMKENSKEEDFLPLVEKMKRKADKGLLNEVKSSDIDEIVKKLEDGDNQEILSEEDEAILMINDVENTIKDYDNKVIDCLEEYSEEELEDILFETFDFTLSEGIWSGIKAGAKAIGSGIKYGAKAVWDTTKTVGKKALEFAKTNPAVAGAATGLAAATGIGAGLLIKHLKKKKKEKKENLTEGYSDSLLLKTKEYLSYLSEDQISSLEDDTDIKDLFECAKNFQPKEEIINETNLSESVQINKNSIPENITLEELLEV